ncbi:hypothetical protein PF001_g11333, partial [Phytophthora fragariae]
IGVAAGTIGAAAVIGSAVSAIRSENTSADVGSTETTEVVDTTETVTNEEVGLMRSKEFGRLCHDLVKNDSEKTLVVLGLSGSTKHGSKLRKVKDASSEWNWLSQFVRFCAKHGKSVASLEPEEARELARTFCAKNFSSFSENLYESGSLDEKRTAWNVSYALSAHFPELAVQEFGVEFGQHKRVLAISEVLHEDKKVTEAATAEVVASMLKESPRLSGGYENVLITEGGKTVFYGSVKSLRAFFQEFGSNQADDFDVTQFLLGLSSDNNAQYQVSVIDGANEEKENQRIQRLSSFVSFADDSVIITDTDLSQEVKKPNFDDNKLSQAAVSSGSTVIEGGAAIVASASVEEKASISSIGAVSASTKESAAVTAATSAASGEESSAALTKAGTAAMSSLYARYAREGSSIESMTFSADIDAAAQEIQRVCTGAASDEAALASLLLSKTAEQRYLIWWRYRILYKQSLTVWVKSTSEYGVLLKMLASPLEHVETEILRKATKGLGTTEEWIYPVVMARSNAEIALLKKTFQEKYGDDLVKVLSGELSGDLKKVILTAMRGEVAEFNASIHTSAKAAADADALYKAGEGRMGTDETTFINILVLSPAEHVRSINTAYAAKYKTDVAGAIKTEFSGDARRALLFLVRSVLEPVDLLAELFETTLQSASKNAYGLSAWVVRYYRLLVRIRIVYMRLYRQELRTRIQSVVSGEYCQLLLSVFDAAEVEFGASASGSGSVSVAAVSASGSGSVSVAAVSASSGAAVRGGAAVSGAAEGGAAISASASVEEKASISSSVVKKTVSSSVTALSSSIVRSLRFGNLYAQSCHDVAGGATLGLYADIEAAVEEIKSSCTGALSDEKSLASILVSKTAEQSYLIWWRYRILYKQSLTVWVKSTSDYGVLLKMLASPLEHVEAEILRKATKGLGTTEEWIYPVVMARSNAEIALLKETYRELYGDDLVNVLRGELSGGLKKIIMAAMQGDVPSFDAAVHTSAKAAADADVLYKAGEGKWGTDEETFIRIVVSSPAEHLRDIDAAYSKKYKKTSIIKAIKGEFKGDAQAALLFHVRMVFEPFELLAGLFESTMKGLGTDEYGLSAAVMRYHVLLPEVKAAYKKLYGKELSQRIRGDTSGEYRDLLLAIVDGQ